MMAGNPLLEPIGIDVLKSLEGAETVGSSLDICVVRLGSQPGVNRCCDYIALPFDR